MTRHPRHTGTSHPLRASRHSRTTRQPTGPTRPPGLPAGDLLEIAQVATVLGIHRAAILRSISDGRLVPAVVSIRGRSYIRIRRADLNQLADPARGGTP
jgi:predicted DNA-binding transcriptional regulator AlpA